MVDQTIPAEFQEQFEKQFEQWRKEARTEQIRVQETIPAEIAKIQAQIDELLPQEARAKAKLQDAERMLREAQANLEKARGAYDAIHWTLFEKRGEITVLKEKQAANGSAVVDEFVAKMNKKLLELRNSIRSDLRPSTPDPVTRKASLTIHSNATAVTKACDYIRDCVRQAEAMRGEPLTNEEIELQLTAIEAGIPSIDVWEIVERSATVFPRDPYERYEAPLTVCLERGVEQKTNELSEAQQFYSRQGTAHN